MPGMNVAGSRQEVMNHALDHSRRSACPLGAGFGHLVHDGRIHSCSPGHRDRGGADQCHSGTKGTVAAPRCFSAAGSWKEGDEMSGIKILAIVLIVAGLLGVLYGKFSYTKETHEAKLGPIEMSVKEKQTVNVPAWAGVAAIAAGAALLLVRTKS